MEEQVLMKADFDPKVKIYWYFQGLLIHFALIFTGLGVLTFPVWFLFGFLSVAKRYEHLSAQLTDRSIHLKSGYIFRVEKTIPLEKIQDLSLRTGPLLSAFGLASVHVETAGGSAQQGADMSLPGLANAEAFRNAVLEQRDKRSGHSTAAPVPTPSTDETVAVLTDIRDSLSRIEELLKADKRS